MYTITDDTYEICRQSYRHNGRLTVTRQRAIKPAASWEDVFRIFAGPESYTGEREEEMENLENCGECSYGGYQIFRR